MSLSFYRTGLHGQMQAVFNVQDRLRREAALWSGGPAADSSVSPVRRQQGEPAGFVFSCPSVSSVTSVQTPH